MHASASRSTVGVSGGCCAMNGRYTDMGLLNSCRVLQIACGRGGLTVVVDVCPRVGGVFIVPVFTREATSTRQIFSSRNAVFAGA